MSMSSRATIVNEGTFLGSKRFASLRRGSVRVNEDLPKEAMKEIQLKDATIKDLVQSNKEKDAALAELTDKIQHIKTHIQTYSQQQNHLVSQLRFQLEESRKLNILLESTMRNNEAAYKSSFHSLQSRKKADFEIYKDLLLRMKDQLKRARNGDSLSDEEEIDFEFVDEEEEEDDDEEREDEDEDNTSEVGSVLEHLSPAVRHEGHDTKTVSRTSSFRSASSTLEYDDDDDDEDNSWAQVGEKSPPKRTPAPAGSEDFEQNYFASIALTLKLNYARQNDNMECGLEIQTLWDQCTQEKVARSDWKKWISKQLDDHYAQRKRSSSPLTQSPSKGQKVRIKSTIIEDAIK
eukprot:TRINITY_DN3668_c0_g1_i3.p1 TRINITY_DN3668_c0_g1~~TRINITY_DN3668_c0_g1_i3.p1  ORF type:complete len:348 (+),score=102.84 TRINITY_DN3668_c0_g1_i3:258-1301(+)